MQEAGGARGALALIKRGYKNVAVIRVGQSAMLSCGFKYRDNGKIKYKDSSGIIRILGH